MATNLAASGHPVGAVTDGSGSVWEWVADFDAPWAGSEENFCGGGAQSAREPSDYPLFLRFAMRRSLRPDYCVPNLGFRCARSCEEQLKVPPTL